VVLGAARLAVRASPSGLRVLKPLKAAETWRIPQHLEGLAGIFRFVSIVSFKSNSYWIAVRWPAGMLGLIDLWKSVEWNALELSRLESTARKKDLVLFFPSCAAWLRPWVAYRCTEVAPLSPEARIALPVTGNRYRIDYRERRHHVCEDGRLRRFWKFDGRRSYKARLPYTTLRIQPASSDSCLH
jgi:hypothetical protein